jgi:hypothetical protein
MSVTKEQVEELYIATFNRASDAEGLDYWVNSGLTIDEIAASFFEQKETEEKYPADQSNEDFVQEIYNNVFNRDGDESGVDYWTQALDTASVTKEQMILAMVNGAQGADQDLLENKTEAGLAFANAGLNDIIEAVSVMQGITDDDTTVTTAHDTIMTFMTDTQTETESTLAYVTDTYFGTGTQEESSDDNSSSDTDSGNDSDGSTDDLMM